MTYAGLVVLTLGKLDFTFSFRHYTNSFLRNEIVKMYRLLKSNDGILKKRLKSFEFQFDCLKRHNYL